jgi:hypothetical protein
MTLCCPASAIAVTVMAAFGRIRPMPRLRDGGTPHGYRAKACALPDGPTSIERADLAAFMLDAVEYHQYPRAIVGVTSG